MGRLYFRLSLTREPPVVRQIAPQFPELHGIALEAHIVDLYPNAIPTFVSSLARPYFVDPVLYKFSSAFFESPDKRWVEPLSEAYHIDSLMLAHPTGFDASDLEASPDLIDIVKSILEYERTRLVGLSRQAAGLATLTGAPLPTAAPPEFLVAPYLFPIGLVGLDTNQKLADIAAKFKKERERLFATIVLPRQALSDAMLLSELAEEYAKLSLDGYLLWVADFREWDEDSTALVAFAGFSNELSKAAKGREVINLFGGYFSANLTAFGILAGSVQGVGISEYRDPTLTGGGYAKRYYLPSVHQSVGVDTASDLLGANAALFTCSCTLCASNPRPKDMTVAELARHFIEVRLTEFRTAVGADVQTILAQLGRDEAPLANLRAPPKTANIARMLGRRLSTWETAFRELINRGLLK